MALDKAKDEPTKTFILQAVQSRNNAIANSAGDTTQYCPTVNITIPTTASKTYNIDQLMTAIENKTQDLTVVEKIVIANKKLIQGKNKVNMFTYYSV